ncbi:MAG: hypothetical protein ACRDSP_20595 [Pseudonocardiaceae bacterium]
MLDERELEAYLHRGEDEIPAGLVEAGRPPPADYRAVPATLTPRPAAHRVTTTTIRGVQAPILSLGTSQQ